MRSHKLIQMFLIPNIAKSKHFYNIPDPSYGICSGKIKNIRGLNTMTITETTKEINTILKSRAELIKSLENYRRYFVAELAEARNFEILMKTYPRLTYNDFENVIKNEGFTVISNTNTSILVGFNEDDKRLVQLFKDAFNTVIPLIREAMASGDSSIKIGQYNNDDCEYLQKAFKLKGFDLINEDNILILKLDKEEPEKPSIGSAKPE